MQTVGRGLVSPADMETLDMAVAVIANENVELATAFIQKKAVEKAGLERTRFFFKPSPAVFFVCFWGFFGVFFIYLPRRESFKGLFSFKNTFKCIQTLSYDHSY
jgi:hypothetical protein